MLVLYNGLPLAVTDSILTVKIHASNQRRRCLHTAAVVQPQKEYGKQKQEYDARNLKIYFFVFLQSIHLFHLQNKGLKRPSGLSQTPYELF
jgi:hypothetical protein